MPEYSRRYQMLVDRVGLEEARRRKLEWCHRSRIRKGQMSPDGPRKPLTREEKLAKRRAWAEKNRGHLREYARNFYAKNAEPIKKEMSERYRKNPEKWAAQSRARRALKAGVLVKPQHCTKCDKERFRLEMHHADYTKPLLIQWLCRPCHRRLHAMLKKHEPREKKPMDEVTKIKRDAKLVYQKALRSGEIVRPATCSRCPSDKHIEAHHWDYTKPLEIEWLCRKCHRGIGHTQPRGNVIDETGVIPPGSLPAFVSAGEVSGAPLSHPAR